jgi:amino acid adenylation domain-containing protein
LYIEPALTDAVNALSQKSGVSLAITLLAVFQSLLSRYTGQTDIAVGSPIANRNRREIEGLVGFFVNSLVMRTDLSGDPSFVEVLGRVQQVSLAAYDHQDLPFEQLVEELQPDRDPSRNPLFQIMFAVQNAPAAAFSLSGVTVRPYVREVTTTRLDLEANVWEHDNGLQVFWVYNTDLFDETTIERFSRHFRQVLEAVVREPRQRLSQISLLSHDERQQILIDWNATDAPLPRAACIHDLVGDQAGRTPDAVALACGEDALSYAELDTRANQLARYLQERYDVGPEVCVGVCMARSADMIVAILGILKAGGAYVPLDPNYPTVRLAYILEDAGVGVLLTQERLVAELPDSQARVVCIDTAPACRSTGPVSAPESRATASNLAYLIYTSGSTGQPKGVAIEHRSAVALVQWAKGWFREEELRGVLASTSMCFDLSVFEMFVPLGAGGSVILAESVLDLRELPNAKDVTLINTVPSGIAALLRQPGLPDSVRTVNLAGEPLKPQLVKQIEEAGQVERVYDLYGPSEDTTYSTGTLRTGDGPEVIGRPIANTQAYVLDGSLQPVPIGVPGDLYLGGAGLARGYYRRPDLTAEKFIPHPYSDQPGARLYKTGDLARYLADGTIKFLGRKDHQVKVRGYRIELGEIETALGQLEETKDVVVVVYEASPDDMRIVAYVVPSGGPLSPSELRQILKRRLPDYMVPAHFVTLDALPLTPNGKIDKKALPDPEVSRVDLAESFVPPRNPVEETLAGIWRDLLQVEQVGMYDNFFELGGHSLHATRVLARVHDEFDVTIPLIRMFEAPTIAGLSEWIENLCFMDRGQQASTADGQSAREGGEL